MSKGNSHLSYLLGLGQFEPPVEPPLFDWRDFRNTAAEIVEEVRRPIHIVSVNGYRERPGTDLGGHEDSLAKLLAEVLEEHAAACSYDEAAAMPRPRERPSASKRPMKFPKGYDYSSYGSPEQIQAEWRAIMAETPKRGRGQPSRSRDEAAFPVKPLVPVYWMAKDWWEKHVGPGFSPNFIGGDDVIVDGAAYDDADDTREQDNGSDYNNGDARFLLCVFRFVQPKCKAKHAANLYDRLRHLPGHKK